ncbi:MAG: GntR family transcriptional regulator [Bacteroidales bacterium]|nr:GntR family transcriptional regulator [Bacteroidales bacterium]MCI5619026.1 GntR family transcriptional regulator [Rikenellaceae bacterium]
MMEFDPNRPIYLQICDVVFERLLSGELKAEDRILSVREYGASIGVNPNTVARSYEKLTDMGVIYNKRGIGYFVSESALEIVIAQERKTFIEEEVPMFLKRMKLLGIEPKDIFKEI